MSATLVREKVDVVDFKPVRQDLGAKLRQLQAARQTEEVQRAISTLNHVLQFFCDEQNPDDACGPSMIVSIH